MHFRSFALLSVCLTCAFAFAQTGATKPAAFKVDDDFVQKQFGSTCSMVEGMAPQTADMDGDGVEDLVLAARCTNPMIDQAEHSFSVQDPYYTFFGYGDPKITTSFVTDDPKNKGRVVLVIHGIGADAWHADKPKAKFVLINLDFKEVTVRKMLVKKKMVTAIYTKESGAEQMVAAIFWDGKKYKYQPMGSTLE